MTDVSTPLELLERAPQLELLGQALASAERASGCLVLVDGEAGVGKTALLLRFLDAHAGEIRALWGSCDPLFTPRPLGPFLDVADAVGGELRETVHSDAKPYDVAASLMRELASATSKPTVLVLDDMHWADEASLDVLRLVARRIESLPVIVVVSYRSHEVGAAHPLRRVIGELTSIRTLHRAHVEPLSLQAVAMLAEPSGVDPVELHQKTAGNPLFVAEVLAAGEDAIPETVRDAVLARAARLCFSAQRLLEVVSVVPQPTELWLLADVEGSTEADVDECLGSGLLTATRDALAFRHELVRLAIEDSLRPDRRAALHRSVLAALERAEPGDIDLARLAHHAEEASDAAAVLRYAPAAAARASALGAHREAAAQYARALRFAGELSLEERAALLNRHSYECVITTQDDDALASIEKALACYRELDDDRAIGAALRARGLVLLNTGFGPEAVQTTREAVTLLESLEPTHELAMSYNALAALASLDERDEEAVALASRGLEIADEVGSAEGRLTALGTLGLRQVLRGESEGWVRLDEAMRLARQHALENQIGRMSVLIGMAAARERSLARMREQVVPALAFCDERDLHAWGRILLAMRGWLELEEGLWDDSAATVAQVLSLSCSLSTGQANIVLGLLRARRGDPDPWTPLDNASRIAERTHQLWWLGQVAAARAEAAWLSGQAELIGPVTEEAFSLSLERRSPWLVAELACWRRRGGIEGPHEAARGPFATQLRGDWAQAAEEWLEAGCPYEAALALADGNADAQRRALADLTRLNARPAAAIVARRMREHGVRGIPRGPRKSTQRNPALLTRRELDVLELLAEGLRNAEIADRLVVSRRTVDHHVSAILRKLSARTRVEAIAAAGRLGILQDR